MNFNFKSPSSTDVEKHIERLARKGLHPLKLYSYDE